MRGRTDLVDARTITLAVDEGTTEQPREERDIAVHIVNSRRVCVVPDIPDPCVVEPWPSSPHTSSSPLTL